MTSKHAIRVSAVVLAGGLAAAWAGDSDSAQPPPPVDVAKALAFQAPPQVVQTPEGAKVKAGGPNVEVSKFDTVSLNVQDADLADVLEQLAVMSQRNIVPSPKVSGKVTANLYDVTFYEALDAILAQNGAGFIEKGNFIYVYTTDELKKIREAERKQVNRVFKLNYMTAEDAATFVTPLASASGKIVSMKGVDEGFQPDLDNGGANTNSSGEVLLVRDFQENVDDIARTLYELDTAPAQVLIEATVLQADLTEELALGVDMSILANESMAASFIGNPLNIVNSMISGSADSANLPSSAINTTVGNVASGKAGVKIGVLTNNVALFVRALDEVTDTTILANPKVMTLNRQRAEVLVGDKIAYLSTTATATATTQTVEFLETGTQLTVRPFISADGNIRMELRPRVSNATLRDVGGGGGIVPDESTQELTSNVMVRDGQTVVLGGLFQEQTTVTRKQVPGFGDIPILGWLGKGKDDKTERSEVIFLLTPHIVKEKMLTTAGQSALEDIDRLRVGTREKLLPWSKSRWSSSHVREAIEYMDKGETDKAMWHVDKALSFDPGFPEARRLKEKLTGERVYTPTRSILEESMDAAMKEQAGRRPRTKVHVTPDPIDALPERPEGYDPKAERYVPVEPVAPPPPPAAVEVKEPAAPEAKTEPAPEPKETIPPPPPPAPEKAAEPAPPPPPPADEPKESPEPEESKGAQDSAPEPEPSAPADEQK